MASFIMLYSLPPFSRPTDFGLGHGPCFDQYNDWDSRNLSKVPAFPVGGRVCTGGAGGLFSGVGFSAVVVDSTRLCGLDSGWMCMTPLCKNYVDGSTSSDLFLLWAMGAHSAFRVLLHCCGTVFLGINVTVQRCCEA